MPISNYPNGFAHGVSILGIPILNTYAGNVFWVDSNAGSDGNKGTRERPFATIDYAIGRCTADNGDIVKVKPGHAETVIAAGGINLDVAGVAIIGLGIGQLRPTITFTTDAAADVDMAAANCLIANMIFKCNIASQVAMITVSAVGCEIVGCEFSEGSATGLSFITSSGAANACDDLRIHHNYMYAPTAGNYDYGIELEEVEDSVRIERNTIIGDFDSAGIHNPTGKVCTHLQIVKNTVHNLLTGQHAIELVSACTGELTDNRLYSDAFATTLDPGSLKCTGNLAASAIDEAGTPIPAIGDSTDNYIGTNSADNDAVTTGVVANEDGSILERLEQLQEAINKGAGTALAAAKSLVDAIGSTGSALSYGSGSILGAIGTRFILEKSLISSNIVQATVDITAAASGDLYLEEIIFETDATGLAAGTNIEVQTDSVIGLATVCSEAVANLGANKTVKGSSASVLGFAGMNLPSTKKLIMDSTVADCTGAGSTSPDPYLQANHGGASIAAA